MTEKGKQIQEYIKKHNLPREGRGFLVMGAYIDSDGHAYEKDWYGNITDHGQVTKPGPVF